MSGNLVPPCSEFPGRAAPADCASFIAHPSCLSWQYAFDRGDRCIASEASWARILDQPKLHIKAGRRSAGLLRRCPRNQDTHTGKPLRCWATATGLPSLAMWRPAAPHDGLNCATLQLAFQPDKLQCRHRGARRGAAMLVSDRRQIKSSRDDASFPAKGVCHALSPTDVASNNWKGEHVRDQYPERITEHKEHCSVVMPLGSTTCATWAASHHGLRRATQQTCQCHWCAAACSLCALRRCAVVQMHLHGEDP